uniref:Galaxin-like repeats domain-containing protein n=2 Tax=Ciona savignyi TaxID=51511 RepID=H2ZBJ7_CIOSA
MKLYIALLAIAAAAVVQGQEGTPPPPSVPPPVGATLIPPARCKRAIQTCAVFDPSTNETTDVDYDHCLQFCCGSAVVDRSTDVVCCGNEVVGVPYNTVTQVCCNYNHQYAAHDLADGGDFCCGLNAYNNTARDLGCCVGYPGDPQMFNVFTEMCCAGIVQFAGDTAYTSCCGDTSYDRRTQSCPCQIPVVAFIPEKDASCCYDSTMSVQTPYNRSSEQCCNGVAYTVDQFCCAGVVGDIATQFCCGNEITAVDPAVAG